MSSSSNDDSRQESLSELWVEFDRIPSTDRVETKGQNVATSSPIKTTPVNSKALEKLLLEAQRESSSTSSHIDSLPSSQASPHGHLSPTNDQKISPALTDSGLLQIDDTRIQQEKEDVDGELAGEWVWKWSSRPEAVPPSFSSLPFKHPVIKRRSLSIRNTRLMRGIVISLENLPLLMFTHACTFALGAASVVFYMKKFCRWSGVGSATTRI